MTTLRLGYHASHEQFAPSELLRLTKLAEEAGFDCCLSSDHFHPWSERQGQSGFSWSWLGAAMEATELDFGIICAPGYRYHPAVVAQAAATLSEMFPERLRLALGSGEAINEAITGLAWPEKAERNALLAECVAVIRALLAGETVTHRGRVTVIEARLYTRPVKPPLILGGAVSEATAAEVGAWADGLITTHDKVETLRRVTDAFRGKAGRRKPLHLKVTISWAATEAEAEAEAVHQWAPLAIGGEVNWDLRRPSDFDRAARLVGAGEMREVVLLSADLGRHTAWLREFVELGFEEIIIHNVGRNQAEFIEAFGRTVLPALRAS